MTADQADELAAMRTGPERHELLTTARAIEQYARTNLRGRNDHLARLSDLLSNRCS